VEQFEPSAFESSTGFKLPYRMISPPQGDAPEAFPLLLFLHGAGQRGTDNSAQLDHLGKELSDIAVRKRYPCYVVAPQCPEDEQWVDTPWTEMSHTMPEEPTVPLQATVELIDNLTKSFPVDPLRIYAIGLSMGGFGTWDLLQRYPELFAAAVPICGGGDPAYAQLLSDVPVWAFHGDADDVVHVQRSREMVHAMQRVGGRPIYTEYPGVEHDSWTESAQNRLLWDWMFSQKRQAS